MAGIAILGDGGHARSVTGALRKSRMLAEGEEPLPDDVLLVGVGDMETRVKLFNKYGRDRFTSVHAPYGNVITKEAKMGPGTVLMRGVTLQPGCIIGDNVLVNTGAQIDHDCVIGDHCIISPGAILCGGVTLGKQCQIGAGAIILEGNNLDDGTKIPAGSLLVGLGDLRRPQRVSWGGGPGVPATY